jgi:glucosylceramidase
MKPEKKCFTTSPARPWRASEPWRTSGSGGVPLRVEGDPGPELLGFGGCFNELGARELLNLSQAERDKILRALFSEEGCGFSFCRVPIGASDYALDWYSHAEVPEDYEMRHFSIDRDRELLLPYIRAAQEIRPDLTLFASPWSPPVWMKQRRRYNGSSLRSEPEVLAAYAHYLRLFVEAYAAEGIPVAQIHVQNEPNSDQKFPSCLWTGAAMRDFIRDHLGPRFEGIDCEIWAGTIERGAHLGWQPEAFDGDSYQNWAHTILSDPGARAYVKGVGYQWNGKGALAQTRANWPNLPIIQTESECGNGQNTWAYAFYTFDLIWQYFHFGCSAYVSWNMVLPAGGESTWGWKQNALISVDSSTGEVTYNPEYYVMKHVAGLVRPGARALPIRGAQAALSLLFENPDGSRILVLANPFAESIRLDLEIPGLPEHLEFEPRSFNTLGCPAV